MGYEFIFVVCQLKGSFEIHIFNGKAADSMAVFVAVYEVQGKDGDADAFGNGI